MTGLLTLSWHRCRRASVQISDVFTRSLSADLPMEEQLRRLQEERTCKVCMDKEVNIVFIPCGHLVVCKECAPSLRKCPICRGLVKGTVRTFLSWSRDCPLLIITRIDLIEYKSNMIEVCNLWIREDKAGVSPALRWSEDTTCWLIAVVSLVSTPARFITFYSSASVISGWTK